MKYPRVLTIAGSDSGGGAGIQADIKVISATGSYAASAITAVTVQNTLGVQDVHPVPVETIAAQISAVLDDIGADAVKIGMLHSSEVVKAVASTLRKYDIRNIVLDPVMVSTSGHRLIEESAVAVLTSDLAPMARVITPNIPEAEILAGEKIASQNDLPRIARKLSCGGKVSVLMKAGHLTEDVLTDVFYNAEEDHFVELKSRRSSTKNTHGTGCTLSSAFASYLAQGFSLDDAASAAKRYIASAIESGARYEIGHGHGPVDHFFAYICHDMPMCPQLVLERCCTSAGEVREALANGASRAELCEELEVGGVTPSEENIRAAVATGLPVNVVVRPRGGSFVFSEEEKYSMLRSISMCRRLGAHGVVIGALKPDGSVDMPLMRELMAEASGENGGSRLSVTFHRAFDNCSDPFAALEDVISLGCDRLLTSGLKDTAPQGAELIAELVSRADGRIIVMPGSGVTPQNIRDLARRTGAREFHGTRLATENKQ